MDGNCLFQTRYPHRIYLPGVSVALISSVLSYTGSAYAESPHQFRRTQSLANCLSVTTQGGVQHTNQNLTMGFLCLKLPSHLSLFPLFTFAPTLKLSLILSTIPVAPAVCRKLSFRNLQQL